MSLHHLIIPAVLVFVLPVSASTINLEIDPSYGSTEDTGSTALITLEFFQQDDMDRLRIDIENTTPGEIGSRLTAVGIELPDVATPVAFAPLGTSAYFDELSYGLNMSPSWLNAPSGFDIAITSDGNLLGGNPNGAPEAGESQQVVLDLGATGLTPVQLTQAVFDFYDGLPLPHAIGRFQSVGPNGNDSDKVGGMVPEPATLILLTSAAAAFGRRRRVA